MMYKIQSAVKQYETVELSFQEKEPAASEAAVDLRGVFLHDGEELRVKGFYAGNGVYKVRFLPEKSGLYHWRVTGDVLSEDMEGCFEAAPADSGHHGPVRASGTHLRFADGTWFRSFGTTVYALMHQNDALIGETMRSLENSPFNKIRICLFPKHYNYNFNEPERYPFKRRDGVEEKRFPPAETPIYPQKFEQRDTYWDVHHPDFEFWDRFEEHMTQLREMGIQIDLILFHPYDRWGFANLSLEDNLTYLDYLLRRFSAYPNVWWSLANEYDLCLNKSEEDWYTMEAFVAAEDPYRHLLSNHNCFRMWDAGRENITHVSWQSKQHYRIAELMDRFRKPVLIDECRYEGNIPEFWGNLSGKDMTRSFWRVTAQGGYCTHDKTFLPGTPQGDMATGTGEKDVVWWAKGGKLNGESPERIAFLRGIMEELPGPLEPLRNAFDLFGKTDEEIREKLGSLPEHMRLFLSRAALMDRRERDHFFAAEYTYAGHCGESAYLYYFDDQCCACADLHLPEDRHYRVEVIDTWNMTREIALENACGTVRADMPGTPYMAVLARQI